MNYQLAYDQLISFRISNAPSGYVEKHHIIPRSLGGTNDKSNIVCLTPKEHFIAHRLLAKIHGGVMWYALAFMSRRNTKSGNGVKVTSRLYDLIKRKDAKVRSKKYSGAGNYWYGKKVPDEMRMKMRGPRPSIAGKNHPFYGIVRHETNILIGAIHSYTSKRFDIDTTVRDRINGMFNLTGYHQRRVKTKELRDINHYYRGVVNLNMPDRDYYGSNNPNYGNGQAISGDKNPMFGKEHKDSTKRKIGEKAKRTLTCPHCGKVGNIANMHRWHLDNCKVLRNE